MSDLVIRPMTVDDVPAAERVSDEGFFELDTRMRRSSGPAPERRSDAGSSPRPRTSSGRPTVGVELRTGACAMAASSHRGAGLEPDVTRSGRDAEH